MIKLFTYISLLFIATSTQAQQLSQVRFEGGTNFSFFSFSASNNLLIRISDDGTILDYGTEVSSIRNNNYYADKLQPYPGRIDYFGRESDSALQGKTRSIGMVSLTYFGHYEIASKVGKIRTLGSVLLDYYDDFSTTAPKGKIKSIGNLAIEYYSAYENEAYRNKIKSIGNSTITYFSSFDDRQLRGRIKSIGPISFDWYTSFDLNRSGLKSGNYRRTINGVTYVLW